MERVERQPTAFLYNTSYMKKRALIHLALLMSGLACNLITSTAIPTASLADDTAISPAATAQTSAMLFPVSSTVQLGKPYDLLIVAPAEFLAPLQQLADWKNRTGITTGILTLDDAYKMCDGRDTPEQIKRCLSMFQKQSGIRFAMLVGDADIFPVRFTAYMEILDEAATSGHLEYYPADLYYADLYAADGSFDTWDSNGNGLYGEIGGLALPIPVNVDKVNLIPDIAVGRVPVSTIEETQTYVNKVISYETKAANADWTRRILAIVTGGLQIDDCKVEEKALADFASPWMITRLYNQGNPCQTTPAITADNIIAEMNRGIGLVSFLGHGNLDLWADAVTVKDFSRMQNAATLPIIFSGGCNTGRFTTSPVLEPYLDVNGRPFGKAEIGNLGTATPPQPAPLQKGFNVDGIMEYSLVQSPNGVVIYIGSVTFGNFGPIFDLNKYFFSGIAAGQPTVGEAWNSAIRSFYQTPPMPEGFKPDPMSPIYALRQPWIFMLFGDPSLRMGGAGKS
jgi:hypothetical protein